MDIFFQILIKQYIVKPECLVLFSDANQYPLDIPLDTLLYNFRISISNNIQFNHNFPECRNFALNMINSQVTFNYLEKYLQQSVNATFENRKYIIFVNSFNDCKKIFSSPAAKFVANLIVAVIRKTETFSINLAKNEDILIEIFTHKFRGPNNNNSNEEIISIDKWFSANETFLYGKNLFYNKINDLNGRIMKVGTFDYSPYNTFSKKKNKWTGIDINLLRTVISYINGTMEIKKIKDYWGYVYANDSKLGSKGDLHDDIIDVATGGFYLSKDVLQFFSPTYPFTQAEITCLIPLPKFGMQGLFPYYAFSGLTWISISISYTILGFTIYLFQYISIYNKSTNNIIDGNRRLRKEMFKSSFFLVGRMLLQQTMYRKEYNFKILISAIMMITMVITISYNAGFTAVMTKPNYDNPINTLEDFLNSDILWGTVQKADFIETWRNDANEKYRNAEKRYVDSSSNELRKISKKGNFAFKIEKVAGRRYCVDNFIKVDVLQNYYVMEGILQTKYTSVLLRKNSIFYPVFQKIGGIISQAGIFAYWANEFANNGDYILQNSINMLHSKRDFTPVILTLPKLFGTFYALIIGELLALVIFIFELIYRQ